MRARLLVLSSCGFFAKALGGVHQVAGQMLAKCHVIKVYFKNGRT